jgi:hypothetical protein
MATLPQYQMARLARRKSSDLDRLAKSYQEQIGNISGNMQTAFTGYQAKAAETNAPFEAARANYSENLLPAYDAQKAKYLSNLDAYNATLAEIQKNPTIEKTEKFYTPEYRQEPDFGGHKRSTIVGYTEETRKYYEPRKVPKFTEKAPAMPDIPQAPEIAAFDDSEFKQQLGQAEQTYKGEMGKRKAGRLNATSRKGARPLLSGASA